MRLRDGRKIKPGEVFEADIKDIPRVGLQHIETLEDDEKNEIPRAPMSDYSLQKRSPGWYDVVNGKGEVVNEGALRKREAEELIATL